MMDKVNRLFGGEQGRETLSTENLHSHQCRQCGCIWRHDPDTIPPGGRYAAHTCPEEGCGSIEFQWYCPGQDGRPADQVPAEFCHNGVRTIKINEPKHNLEAANDADASVSTPCFPRPSQFEV